MKALKLVENNQLSLVELGDPHPNAGEVRVKLKAAALNKRDYWMTLGKYPDIKWDTILGSDGAGIVDELGDGVNNSWLNQDVIINPNVAWGNNPAVQSAKYRVLGMPNNGTFAEYIIVEADRLCAQPKHLNFEQGAALPLAGLTAFRACVFHGKVTEGMRVLISGFGGGVAHFAFLFAHALGAKVSITTGSQSNMLKAMELGAVNCYNYQESDWMMEAGKNAHGFDLIIDSAGGNQFNDFIKILNPSGKIVFFGASNGLPEKLDLYRLFWKQGTIQGSTMGNDEEFHAMVKLVEDHQIIPLIGKKYPFNQIASAIMDMKNPSPPGKTVITF